MGHNTLSNKLDQIQTEDLGIHFNDSLLWEDLSAKLGNKNAVLVERRLLIAACITLLILLFPIVLIKDVKPTQLVSQIQSTPEVLTRNVEEVIPLSEVIPERVKVTQTVIHSIETKGITDLLASIDHSSIDLKPIPIFKEEKIERHLFANQDISIIQASLGTPSIEKEKSLAIRAQLHTSSQPVQLNNQAFKIKLFDASNQ